MNNEQFDGDTLGPWREWDELHDLLAEINRLRNALMTCAQSAGDDPFFNEGGEGYEALFGGEEE